MSAKPAADDPSGGAVTTKLKCPKCGSRNFMAVETIEGVTEFQVSNGVVDRENGIHEFGAYVRLEARCLGCLHRWKVRNAIQIDNIVEEPRP